MAEKKRYEVELFQIVERYATLEVEAESEESACDFAWDEVDGSVWFEKVRDSGVSDVTEVK